MRREKTWQLYNPVLPLPPKKTSCTDLPSKDLPTRALCNTGHNLHISIWGGPSDKKTCKSSILNNDPENNNIFKVSKNLYFYKQTLKSVTYDKSNIHCPQ